VTNGCSGEAEEGNPRTHLRSAGPSLGLSAHVARATGRRRRKASSRWTAHSYRQRQSPHGEKPRSGQVNRSAWLAARRPHPLGRMSHHGAQNAKKVAAFVALRGSRLVSVLVRRSLNELQKSIGDHCWSHRSSFTGQKAGSLARAMGSERGPSPRRRTLLTREKSRAEAEPRANQASRDEGSMRGLDHLELSSRPVSVQPPRMRVLLSKDSRHGGHRHLGAAQAAPTRNGPYRWKASTVRAKSSPFTRRWRTEPRRLSLGRTHAKA
jgi:hypothetical protein